MRLPYRRRTSGKRVWKFSCRTFAAHDIQIEPDDQIIAIAADDDQLKISDASNFRINEAAIRQGVAISSAAERVLILGWNKRGALIVCELENYVAPTSSLTVFADVPNLRDELTGIAASLQNLKMDFRIGDVDSRALLDSLDLISYQHIIILCYAEELEAQAADAKTLMTLLHLRDIEEKKGESFIIVGEMLDVRNRALAEVTKADDLIVSDKLTGLMLTQISENAALL